MGSLSDIANVTISTLAAAIKQPGFGVPLIADFHTRFSERIRFYTSLSGMTADGFTVNDGAYRAAAAIFNQSPQVQRLAIGRRANAPTLQIDVTPAAVNDRVYRVELLGTAGQSVTVLFTSDSTATVAEIVAGLVAAINTAAVGITATNQTTFIRCSAAAGVHFAVAPEVGPLMTVQQTHTDPGIAADLAAIQIENGDWYGLTLSTQGRAETLAAATWAESNKKLAFFSTQDSDTLAAPQTDVAGTIRTANQFRSAVWYNRRAGMTHIGAAALGSIFPFDPGSITAKFRRLAGVSTDPLTATEITNLNAKNANHYTDYGGISLTAEGKVGAGEFIDVIRDRDWFEARLQVRIVTALTNSPKVPFTDAGIAVIESELRAQLREGVTSGFLDSDPATIIVNVPRASEVAPADRANRRLRPITFQARIAGAIHAVDLTGTITV
jgi:hypothetical protein